MSIRSLRAVAAALATALLAVAGCNRPEVPPLRGEVLYKGKPAAGAIVTLLREGEPDTGQARPGGTVDEQGVLRIGMPGGLERVPPGKYAVLVQWPEPTTAAFEAPSTSRTGGKIASTKGRKRRPQKAADRFKNYYNNASRPRLHAEIAAGGEGVGTITLDDPDPKELARDAPPAVVAD